MEFTQNKRVYYYEGSILPIEWTNQHGCGSNSKTSCEIVLQYACEDTLDPQVDDVSAASRLVMSFGLRLCYFFV